MKNKLFFSSKKITDSEYAEASSEGLLVNYETLSGDGTPDNPYKIRIALKNSTDRGWTGLFHVEIKDESNISSEEMPFFFMPGFIYGTNTGYMPSSGRKEFPRIVRGAQNRPESEYWFTRSDRLACPLSMVYSNGRIYGIGAKPYYNSTPSHRDLLFCGFSCNLNHSSVGYTLGYEDAPWLFVQTATVLPRTTLSEKNCFSLDANEEFTFDILIYDFESQNKTDLFRCLRNSYKEYHEPVRQIDGMNVKKAARLLSEAVRDYAWIEEDSFYTGFVYDKPTGYSYNKIGSLSWTNGLSVAVPMLISSIRLDDSIMKKQALKCIDFIVSTCMNENSGLPYDGFSNCKWGINGWWVNGMHTPGHSGYIVGQAIYYILKAYEYEESFCGIKHTEWLDFSQKVIEKVNREMNSDFEYPFSFSEETGAGQEYLSLGSCWCLAATVYYEKITGDTQYHEKLLKSEAHYYNRYVSRLECMGGPLDTDKAIDNEGILAYIRAARLLHILTNDKKYLDHLKLGLDYECSYKLCYNTPVQFEPLKSIHWSSCGGSITSVANPHIHPMSNTIIDDMQYYCEKTGDEYILSRLNDTILWGMQTFNSYEKEYGYGRIGWMSERFCFCQGLLTEKYPDGTPSSTWFALMPWASASVIEGFVGDIFSIAK